ncbi:ParB/RepB/Spo0J family partition protein [Staphylococcus felis]|uniref:ParB/RepB/Spo0J family partition protein n=1 Tax=Staphylococcus felis TaxID=46127 RepID=UPI0021D3E61E|nr:ParB/RepB/Spo0J family partition protein [Staphylococcus felis]UXR86714.1 ParB/RepB/Spo0J family partition protein [Staphylococcus felis]
MTRRIEDQSPEDVKFVSLDKIRPNPYQPRKDFDVQKLHELAQSIGQHGLLQPIILTPSIQGYYIVAGERRYRASQQVGLTKIPAIIKTFSDEEMREIAIIENLQRDNLNPLEEAESYEQLMDNLNLTQQEVAERLGKSRPYIANMLRLLKLPTQIRTMIRQDQLSSGHGRTLLALKERQLMQKYADLAVRESWSVRYLEQQVNAVRQKGVQAKSEATQKPSKPKLIRQHEAQLRKQYGTGVEISTRQQVGHVTFEFHSESDYHRLIKLLKQTSQ